VIAPNADRAGAAQLVEGAHDGGRSSVARAAHFSCYIIGETTLVIRCASSLLARGHRIHGIISDNPDVVRWAAEAAISVIDPRTDFAAVLVSESHDFLFSIVNERILAPAVIAAPRRLAINYHDAPLPRYAGMHATSWAIMNGETSHGISWHVASAVVDAGDIVAQRSVAIDPDDTALSLNAKCYDAAADAFVEMVETIERGELVRRPQDLSQRTYFGRFQRPPAAAILDWREPVAQLSALVRALDFGPYPNPLGRPKILLPGAALVCRSLTRSATASGAASGTIVGVGQDTITVAAGDGDAVVAGIGLLSGGELPPDALTQEFGLRVRTVLPLPSEELKRSLSAGDAAAAKAEPRWRARLSEQRSVAAPFARECPTSGSQRWHTIDVSVPDSFANPPGDAGSASAAMRLAAAVAIYLRRVSRERELDIGLRVSADTAALEPFFASVVPIRLRPDTSASFHTVVGEVAAEVAKVARLGPYSRDLATRYPPLRGRPLPRHQVQLQLSGTPDFGARDSSDVADLHFTLDPVGSRCRLSYRDGALTRESAMRAAGQIETLLAAVADEPERTVSRLAIVPEGERRRLLVEWNDTAAAYPSHLTVHALVAAQATRTPNATALTDGRDPITYRELEARAEAVAERLRALGVGRGSLVGVFAGRSAALVVALLGVLKAGGAYVPLDVDYPAERLRFIVDDAALTTFVIEPAVGRCPAPANARLIALDASGRIESATEDLTAPASPGAAGPGDLAYVIYTSGSTGRPKGAMITHRGVVNYVTWAAHAYRADAGAGAPLHSSPAFDLTVTTLFAPLVSGTPVQLVDQALGIDALAEVLRSRPRCSLVKLTPAHLTLLSQQLTPDEAATATNAFIIGGENLIGESLEFWRRHAPATVLVNEYGPTETVVGCCVYRVAETDRFTGAVPIGRPIANTRLYVLDDGGEPLPEGIAGELYIGGDGVGLGYLNRPELTAERFVRDPFVDEPAARMYRTGDLVRHRGDGNLEFLGRLDDQIKMRGFRIELGEIEAVLAALPGVQSAAVVVREYGPDDQRLVGYFVPDSGIVIDTMSLRESIERVLPDYMVPACLVRMDGLPLTENGKVDRKALPRPDLAAPPRVVDATAPRGDLERTLAAIWEEALVTQHVSRTDNFFELGGHSLLLQRVRTMVKERTGATLSTADMFRHPTIAGLSMLMADQGARAPSQQSPQATARHEGRMTVGKLVRRFLVPGFVNSIYYFARFRATLSPRAEVEISPLLTFGRGCAVGSFTKIKATDGPVRFGDRCGIANSCFITGGERGIHIGDNFGCGPSVSIISSSFVWERVGTAPSEQGLVSSGIRIGNNVWVGANVTILDGAEIGDDTIVAAGSVVEGKHPPRVILRGNPAQVIAHR
jgi:amino acid adenylation domain-containing protein